MKLDPPCETCGHARLTPINPLCLRAKRFIDGTVVEGGDGSSCAIERLQAAWPAFTKWARIDGDVCGPEGKHWKPRESNL